MDGIHSRKGVCTIAATNKIEFLDESIRSRFEEEIRFALPNAEERLAILEKNAETLPAEMGPMNLAALSRQTEGFSGRDLVEKVLKVALHGAIIDDVPIEQRHLEEAAAKAKKETNEPPREMFS